MASSYSMTSQDALSSNKRQDGTRVYSIMEYKYGDGQAGHLHGECPSANTTMFIA